MKPDPINTPRVAIFVAFYAWLVVYEDFFLWWETAPPSLLKFLLLLLGLLVGLVSVIYFFLPIFQAIHEGVYFVGGMLLFGVLIIGFYFENPHPLSLPMIPLGIATIVWTLWEFVYVPIRVWSDEIDQEENLNLEARWEAEEEWEEAIMYAVEDRERARQESLGLVIQDPALNADYLRLIRNL